MAERFAALYCSDQKRATDALLTMLATAHDRGKLEGATAMKQDPTGGTL
jgi:hypothetical protein